MNTDNIFSILLRLEGCASSSGEFMLEDVVECSLLRALGDPMDGTDGIKCFDVPIGRPKTGNVLAGKLRAYLTVEKLSTLWHAKVVITRRTRYIRFIFVQSNISKAVSYFVHRFFHFDENELDLRAPKMLPRI